MMKSLNSSNLPVSETVLLLSGFRCFAFHDSGTPDDEESRLFQLPVFETVLLPSEFRNPASPCSLKNVQVLLDPTLVRPRAQI
jgi:hypothetical protein